MHRTLIYLCAVTLFATTGHPFAARAQDQQTTPRTAVGLRDWSLSGPHTHKNLAVYLVHGPDLLKGRTAKNYQASKDGSR